MSFFDDYVADGLCCQCCGVLLDMSEPGHPRWCDGCAPGDADPLLVSKDYDPEDDASETERGP